MGRASEQGIIFIEGTGPTYATGNVSVALQEFWCLYSLSIYTYVIRIYHDTCYLFLLPKKKAKV